MSRNYYFIEIQNQGPRTCVLTEYPEEVVGILADGNKARLDTGKFKGNDLQWGQRATRIEPGKAARFALIGNSICEPLVNPPITYSGAVVRMGGGQIAIRGLENVRNLETESTCGFALSYFFKHEPTGAKARPGPVPKPEPNLQSDLWGAEAKALVTPDRNGPGRLRLVGLAAFTLSAGFLGLAGFRRNRKDPCL